MTKKTCIWAALGAIVLLTSACKPKYPNCEKDDHCREGEYCVNGRCQQCRDDGDCPGGQECAEGACRDVGYCESTADCAGGQVCRNNRCGPCLSNDDCSANELCLDGRCAEPECRSDEDCPAGLVCTGNRCVQEPQTGAAESGECEIESLYFAFDSAEVPPDMRRRLERNYECLSETEGTITLEGHADPRGTTEYNMALGDRRARMVRKLLKTVGTDTSRLKVVSKGEEEATGYNEETWAKDRRVDFE